MKAIIKAYRGDEGWEEIGTISWDGKSYHTTGCGEQILKIPQRGPDDKPLPVDRPEEYFRGLPAAIGGTYSKAVLEGMPKPLFDDDEPKDLATDDNIVREAKYSRALQEPPRMPRAVKRTAPDGLVPSLFLDLAKAKRNEPKS